eukprot:GILK01004635.1.p1 GENE.GILK01004635.1~~GILK01004635.1.p1  ORF type:complete len:283 (-),score=28.43 GILK01004635.1:537-1385(-)
MRLDVYTSLCAKLGSRANIESLSQQYNVPYDTLVSMYGQKYQEEIRKTQHIHKRPQAIRQYLQWYEEGQHIALIAQQIGYSSYLLARLILEHKLEVGKPVISQLMKDPSRIAEPRLREEVVTCIEEDANYSPYIDRIRRLTGLEYEYILMEKLRNRGIAFSTEDDLRRRGSFKTPDIKLEVPIGVHGRVIHWIESKAMFGDEYTHAKHLEDQLRQYVNRHGSGMVVYWFDFIESLNCDKDILLVSDLPADLVQIHKMRSKYDAVDWTQPSAATLTFNPLSST